MEYVPTRETIRRREVGRLVHRLRWMRGGLISLGALLAIGIEVVGSGEHRLALAAILSLLVPILVFDLVRLHRPPEVLLGSVPLDLVLGAMVQTAVIVVTGGIESPLFFVYVPLPLVAGSALGPGRSANVVLGVVLVLPWLVLSASAAGWIPSTVPRWLGLDPGFAETWPYGATRVLVVNIACIFTRGLGLLIHATVNRMLDRAIEARQEALTILRERNRELVNLSSAIAHELKNPLASVKGLVQLLQRGEKNAERRWEMLNREIDRTRQILDEFLNFARPLGDLTVQPVVLEPLLEELAFLHEGLAAEKHVEIIVPTHATTEIASDPRKLKQALVNLLQNALEAAPPKTRVEMVLRARENHVEVGVRDHGPGLDSEIKSRLLEPGVTTKPSGSGIGLAVARTIAEQHGGQLRIEKATPRGGCEAWLALPYSPAPFEEDGS